MLRSVVVAGLCVVMALLSLQSLAQQVRVRSKVVGISRQELLLVESVQKELKLSEEQKSKFIELDKAANLKRDRVTEEFAGLEKPKTGDKFDLAMFAIDVEVGRTLPGILNGDQLQRFHQIWFQYCGLVGLIDPELQKAISLREDQKKAIGNLSDERSKELDKIDADAIRTNLPKEERIKKIMDLNEKTYRDSLKVLDVRQKQVLEELEGPPFKLTY